MHFFHATAHRWNIYIFLLSILKKEEKSINYTPHFSYFSLPLNEASSVRPGRDEKQPIALHCKKWIKEGKGRENKPTAPALPRSATLLWTTLVKSDISREQLQLHVLLTWWDAIHDFVVISLAPSSHKLLNSIPY